MWICVPQKYIICCLKDFNEAESPFRCKISGEFYPNINLEAHDNSGGVLEIPIVHRWDDLWTDWKCGANSIILEFVEEWQEYGGPKLAYFKIKAEIYIACFSLKRMCKDKKNQKIYRFLLLSLIMPVLVLHKNICIYKCSK